MSVLVTPPLHHGTTAVPLTLSRAQRLALDHAAHALREDRSDLRSRAAARELEQLSDMWNARAAALDVQRASGAFLTAAGLDSLRNLNTEGD